MGSQHAGRRYLRRIVRLPPEHTRMLLAHARLQSLFIFCSRLACYRPLAPCCPPPRSAGPASNASARGTSHDTDAQAVRNQRRHLGFSAIAREPARRLRHQLYNATKPKQYARSYLFPSYKNIDWARQHFPEYDNLTHGYYKAFYGWRRPAFHGQTINIDDTPCGGSRRSRSLAVRPPGAPVPMTRAPFHRIAPNRPRPAKRSISARQVMLGIRI